MGVDGFAKQKTLRILAVQVFYDGELFGCFNFLSLEPIRHGASWCGGSVETYHRISAAVATKEMAGRCCGDIDVVCPVQISRAAWFTLRLPVSKVAPFLHKCLVDSGVDHFFSNHDICSFPILGNLFLV